MPRLLFILAATLAALGQFVVDGSVGGVMLGMSIVVFLLACIRTLKGEDPDLTRHADRAGLSGFGG
jgi:hypothetical protein